MPTITIGRSGNGNGGSSRGSSGGSSGGSSSRDYPSGRDHGGGHSSGTSSESKSSGSYVSREAMVVSQSPHDYSYASQKDIDKHFVTTYDSSNGRLDINGFCLGGYRALWRVLDHLKYQAVQRDTHNGTGHKVLAHKHTLNFSFNLLGDTQIKGLADVLFWQESNLKELNLSFNSITCKGIEPLFYQLRTAPDVRYHNIQFINLSNNQIGDSGANYIAESLKSGRYPATRKIDLSGNGITQKGDTKIVQALKGVWQDIVVFTHTLDEINKMSGDEGKEAQVKALKSVIARGKAIGTYDEAMVVDKSFLGSIKNTGKGGLFGIKWLFGFGKCHLLPESEKVAKSYAQDKIIATLPKQTESGLKFAKKYVGKLISFHDIITCFVTSREEVITSELGQEVTKHDLCVIGVDEFCGNQ